MQIGGSPKGIQADWSALSDDGPLLMAQEPTSNELALCNRP